MRKRPSISIFFAEVLETQLCLWLTSLQRRPFSAEILASYRRYHRLPFHHVKGVELHFRSHEGTTCGGTVCHGFEASEEPEPIAYDSALTRPISPSAPRLIPSFTR